MHASLAIRFLNKESSSKVGHASNYLLRLLTEKRLRVVHTYTCTNIFSLLKSWFDQLLNKVHCRGKVVIMGHKIFFMAHYLYYFVGTRCTKFIMPKLLIRKLGTSSVLIMMKVCAYDSKALRY